MTFTSILLGGLIGIAVWQLITLIGFMFGLEDNEYFVFFTCCFYTIPLLLIQFLRIKISLFLFNKMFVKATFYTLGQKITECYMTKKDKELFETDTSKEDYVVFEKTVFKSLPCKKDVYKKDYSRIHNIRIDSYLKKGD